ncbi:MAG: MBL fold metallo-hydrolase [Akkermansiaceae bacterium]|nr:MBL fold metallo-hydrolase [Armatimonadota bacterium]
MHPVDNEIVVHCLASGSSGNAVLVVAGRESLLVDAGLGVRTITRELKRRGVAPEFLSGVLLTHEHIDHVRGAVPLSRRYKIPLIGTDGTLQTLLTQEGRDAPTRAVDSRGEIGVGVFGVRAVRTTHDAADPVGFRVSVGGFAFCYATDTGTLTPEFREACVGASLVAVEANHDIHKLRFGPYPDIVKSRILSREGHLSNNAACDFLLAHVADHGPICAWLSHLSDVNNTPRMALNYWKKRYTAEGCKASPAAVEVALRDKPSLVFRARSRSVQLALF